MRELAAAIALLLIAAPAWGAELRATDGDSVRLGKERIRIADIDAPELAGYRCPAERRAAEAARRALQRMLREGPIRIERLGWDKYRRTLARLHGPHGDIGARLVREGYARRYEGRRRSWC